MLDDINKFFMLEFLFLAKQKPKPNFQLDTK